MKLRVYIPGYKYRIMNVPLRDTNRINKPGTICFLAGDKPDHTSRNYERVLIVRSWKTPDSPRRIRLSSI
ncbi:hypothetical protein SAMN04488121_10755 [Chitinophaga filiformis]|uniref:Uncharacterized protein n=1 Tax=Chitinophaga filiformis TaxID=104663 RepID=A0A1G7XRY9_CHIFI|nr:hypothetical protein SAMN04488121_10755 [Chitinophaga filiformis]